MCCPGPGTGCLILSPPPRGSASPQRCRPAPHGGAAVQAAGLCLAWAALERHWVTIQPGDCDVWWAQVSIFSREMRAGTWRSSLSSSLLSCGRLSSELQRLVLPESSALKEAHSAPLLGLGLLARNRLDSPRKEHIHRGERQTSTVQGGNGLVLFFKQVSSSKQDAHQMDLARAVN